MESGRGGHTLSSAIPRGLRPPLVETLTLVMAVAAVGELSLKTAMEPLSVVIALRLDARMYSSRHFSEQSYNGLKEFDLLPLGVMRSSAAVETSCPPGVTSVDCAAPWRDMVIFLEE